MNLVVRTVLRPITQWAETSQQTACRNAMVASTSLASRRREAEETQEYVRVTLARRAGRSTDAGTVRVPMTAGRHR